jgi:hypothetical protein
LNGLQWFPDQKPELDVSIKLGMGNAAMFKANGNHELGGATQDLAVAQFLELAKGANVAFELSGDRLVMRSSKVNWKRWSTVRHYLDELGVEAITEYFKRNSPQERAALSAAA